MKLRDCENCKLSSIDCTPQKGCNPFCVKIDCDSRVACSSGATTTSFVLERYLDCENEKVPMENWLSEMLQGLIMVLKGREK